MPLTLKIDDHQTKVLVESLMKNLEEKDKKLLELEDLERNYNRLEERDKELTAAIEILTDYMAEHHQNLPQLVEYAKKAALADEYECAAEGAFTAVAWYLERDDSDVNLSDFKWFQNIVKNSNRK